jgi:hypothetical protein
MTVTGLGKPGAPLQKPVEPVAPEPRPEPVEVVGAHLIDRDHEDEGRPLGAREADRQDEEGEEEDCAGFHGDCARIRPLDPARRRTGFGAILLVAAVAVAACGEKRDPVRRAIDDMAAAASEQDASAIVASLAADFQAADGTGRADAEATLRRYLAAYESLDVKISDLTIESAAGAARARFQADLSGKPRSVGGLDRFLPRTSRYRFDLRLAPEPGGGDRWLVTWAGWEQTE